MSLSKIGKVSNAVKLLNTAATSGDIATGISSLSNSLRAAGNMSAGVNWISKYGKVLDSGIAYQALKQAFPEESLTEDMLAKIGYTANGAGKVGNASKFSSVGSTFAGLGTFLKSIWPVLAVVGGIAAGTAAWKWADDKFTITKATAKKHSDESAQAYQNAKTELSTKQSQYDTNQDRIHELRATQNRTSDENAELSQLTKENSLLGTQVSVQKKLVDAKAQQQAIDADMNLNKKYTTSQAVANEYSDSVVAKQEDIVEETTRKVNELAELQKKRDAAYQKLDQMSADDEGFTEQQNIANQMDDRVSKKQSEIADAMDEISDDYNRLFDEDTGALINPKTKDTAKSVEDLFSLYGRVTDSAQEETDRINNIFAKAKFDGVEDQLVNAGKSGGTDAVKAKISEIDGLQEALDNAGISADTLASNIMAIARPDEKNLEAAKYFSQNGFEDADNFIENYNKLKNYYTDDASGPKRFLSDLEAKGLATYKTLEDGNQQWMYSFTDTQEAADAMGMSLESFESMFGRLKDYGDTNNFVSSLEEGALKSEEIDDKLIDAQIKMGKLKASGANQSALDDQQAVIDNLIAQKTGITQAISDFKDGTVDRKIQDIKDAKGSIDELNQYIKDNGIDKDSDLGKKYIESIQEQAKKTGIKLTPEFEVDEAAYNEMIQSYEAKAKGSQIKHFQDVNEGIESGNTGDYSDSDVELVNKIKDAQEQKSEALQNVIDAVNSLDKDQWNEANQIELGNGAYESEDQGIRNVEDALQGLSDQFGLTKEQATALLPALEALGVVNIDPNVDMTGLDELDQATQDGMASLRQMQADGDIKLSFDVDSSIEGLSVDKLQSQIGELEHIKVNFDVDSSEYKAIQSMIDQREMQMHVQIAVDKTGDIDKLLSLNDEELAQKAELDVDVNTEDGKAKIDELRSSLESLSGDTPAISVKIDETQFQALTKEQQGQGTVTFKPEHSEVDAYLAEEKKSEGKVKWSNETGLVDVYAATEHYSHGTVHWGNDISAVQTSFTATGTVNWINSGGPSGGLSKEVQLSSGTFKAKSTGSAYNVLNITPAHNLLVF